MSSNEMIDLHRKILFNIATAILYRKPKLGTESTNGERKIYTVEQIKVSTDEAWMVIVPMWFCLFTNAIIYKKNTWSNLKKHMDGYGYSYKNIKIHDIEIYQAMKAMRDCDVQKLKPRDFGTIYENLLEDKIIYKTKHIVSCPICGNFFQRSGTHHKTCGEASCIIQFKHRPEVKIKFKKYKKGYRQRPDVKAKQIAYQQRPYVVAKRKAYEKVRCQKPEVKARKNMMAKIRREKIKARFNKSFDVLLEGILNDL